MKWNTWWTDIWRIKTLTLFTSFCFSSFFCTNLYCNMLCCASSVAVVCDKIHSTRKILATGSTRAVLWWRVRVFRVIRNSYMDFDCWEREMFHDFSELTRLASVCRTSCRMKESFAIIAPCHHNKSISFLPVFISLPVFAKYLLCHAQ